MQKVALADEAKQVIEDLQGMNACAKCSDLIERLIMENERLRAYADEKNKDLEALQDVFDEQRAEIEAKDKEIELARKEFEAAIRDLNTLRKRSGFKCFACLYDEPEHSSRSTCAGCGYNNDNNWAYRGLRAENRGADDAAG